MLMQVGGNIPFKLLLSTSWNIILMLKQPFPITLLHTLCLDLLLWKPMSTRKWGKISTAIPHCWIVSILLLNALELYTICHDRFSKSIVATNINLFNLELCIEQRNICMAFCWRIINLITIFLWHFSRYGTNWLSQLRIKFRNQLIYHLLGLFL